MRQKGPEGGKTVKKRRLLFFTYHFPYPEKPGSFRPWVEAIILKDMGYDVTVITSGVDHLTGVPEIGWRFFKKEEKNGIRIVKVFSLPFHRTSSFKRVINYFLYSIAAFFIALFEKKPERLFIANTSYFITVSFYLYRILRARGVPFILDERDMLLESFVTLGFMRKGVIYSILEKWDNFLRERACAIFTVSSSIKEALVKKGVPSSKIEMVPSVDVELMEGGIEKYRSAKIPFFNNEKKFVVMYTGSFGRVNDVTTILKAAEYIRKDEPDIRFVLVGTGERLPFYKNYIKEKNLDNVIIVSGVGREEARNFLYHADICVHAFEGQKLWNVALSSKIFDYFLFRKPIIFCGDGEIKRHIEEADAGLCVEPQRPDALARAINTLYSRKPELHAMGQRGERFIKDRYSVESVYASFENRLARI